MLAHRARKRFGQNFLVDASVIAKIVDAVDPQASDRIVEIGPGLGALTTRLLERVDHLHAIEIDRDLAGRLAREIPAHRLTVHLADALEFDFRTLGTELRIVGNLPYNISSPLLFHLADQAIIIRDAHVMLQREVVDRMVAKPGTAQYGRLTVTLGYRFEIERVLRVRAGAFRPVPKVDSAFVRLRPRESLPWPAHNEQTFLRVVKAAFGQRRKTLRNALSGFADGDQLRRAGVDPSSRGECLEIAAFVAIANTICATET